MRRLSKPFIRLENQEFGVEWKGVWDPEYDIKPYYIISNKGTVISLAYHTPVVRAPIMNEDGYLRIQLQLTDGSARYFQLHRLVMYAFAYFPGCEKLQVNHIHGQKDNPSLEELEWCTASYNIQHAVANNLFAQMGERSTNCTISDKQVHEVCKLWNDGLTAPDISKLTGISVSGIYDIAHGSRAQITSQYNLQPRLKKGFDNEQIHIICKYFEDNPYTGKSKEYFSQLANYMGLEFTKKFVSNAYHILDRSAHSNISKDYNF